MTPGDAETRFRTSAWTFLALQLVPWIAWAQYLFSTGGEFPAGQRDETMRIWTTAAWGFFALVVAAGAWFTWRARAEPLARARWVALALTPFVACVQWFAWFSTWGAFETV